MKVPMFMERGAGYLTADGIKFTSDHPYQLVEESEVSHLISLGKFREATIDEISSYYNYKPAIINREEKDNYV